MMDMCSPDFGDFLTSTVLVLAAYAAVVTSILIGVVFMVGRVLNNPRLTVWAKTEVVQLPISVASVLFIVILVNLSCGLYADDLASMFQLPEPMLNDLTHITMYDAADTYLREAAYYSHNAVTVIRYHLEAYMVLSYVSEFECDASFGNIGIGLGCLFGYSGTSLQPFGGYGALMGALNIFFNSVLTAHFMALNSLFIYYYVKKGFAFLFLPLGIFLRSMPYLRRLGSLFIAVALSFMIVYPFMLSLFYIMGDVLVDRADNYIMEPGKLGYFVENEDDNFGWNAAAVLDVIFVALAGPYAKDLIKANYFSSGEYPVEAMGFGANAFIAAFFMPTIALLAAIASVSYIGRLFGEEVGLSRILQMV